MIPWLSADVVVAGAGAAGMAAAISAARQGADVLLIEKGKATGGTVVHGLIHTLGGLYDTEGNYLNAGLPQELAERIHQADQNSRPRKIGKTYVLSAEPSIYGQVTEKWLEEEGVHIARDCIVAETQTINGRIVELIIQDKTGNITAVRCGAVIDCTGSAEVVRKIDAHHVVDEEEKAAAGLIFQLENVEREALIFPRNIEILRSLRSAAERGLLPEICTKTWIDIGVKNSEAYAKLFVPMSEQWRLPTELERAAIEACEWRDTVLAQLRTLSGFAAATLVTTGQIGIRDGGRIVGNYLLTVQDVRTARKFSDPACRCNWPIEYWHPQYGVQLEYLYPGSYYEIPRCALRVSDFSNLWATVRKVPFR